MTETLPPVEPGPEPSRRRQTWRWLVIGALALAILLAAGRLLFFDVHDGKEQVIQNGRWDGKPRFVATTYPTYGLPANAGIRQRIWIAWIEFQKRHGRKNPAACAFGANGVSVCSVHGLLNQCMEVTGTKYLIATEAAAGLVVFGHTNTLNGVQWVAAFEAALQTNQPSWWDNASHRMRQENLLLIREKSGVVKVLPPSRLADYQKAGLVDLAYPSPPASKP